MTIKDVAKAMSVSPGTVKTHLFRARAKFQVKLQGRDATRASYHELHEIAATMQATLLHQRDPRWVRNSSSCGAMFWIRALLELHKVEERLAGLFAIEPASDLVESVMNRVMQPQPVELSPARQLLVGMFKYSTMFVGALILASAYLVPGAGQSWLSNLWPSARPLHQVGLSASLAASPLGDGTRRICRPADPHGPGPAGASGPGESLYLTRP